MLKIDLKGLKNDETYVNNLLKKIMRRFMNLNKKKGKFFNFFDWGFGFFFK
ncbi:MAG: hypothetical protein CM15mP3_10780 [Candidatus Poseidoniales archaeon]|nr:MAG: hypothetical protein CM15mP3_10780 [Candidatus Poseidoniales archaeon]